MQITLPSDSIQADQDYIVDRHNELRRFIAKGLETRGAGGGGTRQEPARNMRKLEWDDELAKVAQR